MKKVIKIIIFFILFKNIKTRYKKLKFKIKDTFSYFHII